MSDVSVIGLGLMGSAIARAFVSAGAETTVWNRTPARAAAIEGASVAETPAVALAASPLTVVVVSDSNGAREVIQAALSQGVESRRTIVNLTTGSVSDARSLNEIIEAAGHSYLDGAITAYPRQIGLPDTCLYVAGPEQVWRTHQDTIRLLGGQTFLVSTSIEGANVVDHAINGIFYTVVMTAFFEAAAYAHLHDVKPSTVADLAVGMLPLVPDELKLAASQFEAGDFDTDQAAIDVYEVGGQLVRSEILRAGLPGNAHHAYLKLLNDAQSRGLGGKALSAVLVPLLESAKREVPA
jgi:3-hydroxyisobutyrate dehydrogenase-like beta-hydroxyacid dehydrogenase